MNLLHLQSDRLMYSPFVMSDYADLYEILSSEITCEYLPGVTSFTDEQIHKWLDYFIKSFSIEKRHVIYAIRLKESSKIIGYTGCNYVPEFQTNEIKYILHPAYFKKGYATEAAQMMKQVAKELGFTVLVGLADVNNIPSQKILEKIGYQYQKTVELWGGTLKYYELHL